MKDDLLKAYRDILSESIKDVCKPLEKFNITFFHYLKKFNDGSRIHLTNKPEWVDFYYNQMFYKIGFLEGKNKLYQDNSYFMWFTSKNQDIFKEAKDFFNIDYGLTLIKKVSDGAEFCYFGTTRDHPEVLNFYLSNMGYLNRFIIYFKDHLKNLIEKAERNKIYAPSFNNNVNLNDLNVLTPTVFDVDLKDEFIKETRPKKYNLKSTCGIITLSSREMDCLLGILEGLSANDVGEKLFISKRTVETHFDHIKQKFGCNDKSQLIQSLVKNGFLLEESIWKLFS